MDSVRCIIRLVCGDLSRRGFLELVAATGRRSAWQDRRRLLPSQLRRPRRPRRSRRCSRWPTCGTPRPSAAAGRVTASTTTRHAASTPQKLQAIGQELGIDVDLADATVTDDAGGTRFIEAAKAQSPDALMILPMGIFSLWSRAEKIFAALDLPTLVFTQIGTSFTMNTAPIAHKPGFHLTSSLDIGDVRQGLEMVKAAANLKQSTLLVIGRNDYQETTFQGDVFGPVGRS